MPSEVTDIKQFLEIARRKDAKCTIAPRLGPILHVPSANVAAPLHSRSREEVSQVEPDQVQDPMQPVSLHVDPQGLRQGR